MKCNFVKIKFKDDLKPLCIELYVRAVAVDVNDLEARRHKGEEVRHVESGLAATFGALAELVQSDVRLCRECVLTAFSLQPTQQRLDRLVKLSELSVTPPSTSSSSAGGGGVDSGPPSQSAAAAAGVDLVSVGDNEGRVVVGEPPPDKPGGGEGVNADAGIPAAGAAAQVLKEGFEDADSGVDVSSDAAVFEEVNGGPFGAAAARGLGVSRQIVDDLAVVLHSCRWEVLHWNLDWTELQELCQTYLRDQDRMRSVTKELK